MNEHRYAGPVVAEDRTVTHSCVCGLTSSDVAVIAQHGADMIERDVILAELQKRNPSEAWT